MTESPTLPLSNYDHVFYVTGNAVIDASQEKVWSILIDFPSYGRWNTFVRSMTLTDVSKAPLSDQSLELGKYASIRVNMPPKLGEPFGWLSSGSTFAKIDGLDHENFRVTWSTANYPHFLLHTKRWQSLSVDKDTGQTRYYTVEAFGGLLAYVIWLLLASKLQVGFQAMADSLKKHSEKE